MKSQEEMNVLVLSNQNYPFPPEAKAFYVQTVAEAQALFQKHEFIFILLDEDIQGNPLDALSNIRQWNFLQSMPPVLFLANPENYSSLAANAYGFSGIEFLLKPLSAKVLKHKISDFSQLKIKDLITQTMPQLAWRTKPNGSADFFSQRFLEYVGYPADEMLGWGWTEVIHPEDYQKVMDEWLKCRDQGLHFSVEFRLKGKNGHYRWFIVQSSPYQNPEGKIVKYYGTWTDIEVTVQRRIEEFAKSRAFLDSLIENLPIMVFVKDAKELRFVRFNKAGQELLGFSLEELKGKNDYDFFPHEQADQFTSKDRSVLSGYAIVDIPEEIIQTKYKGSRILHTKKIPLYDAQGVPEYLLGISEDITDQKKAESERLNLIKEQVALSERESSTKKMAFLAEASTVLASSLDYHETLLRLAKLTVPALAEWTSVTMLKEDGDYERLASVHSDNSKSYLLDKLSQFHPKSKEGTIGVTQVISSGTSFFSPMVKDDDLVKAAKSEEHLAVIRELGCTSCMIVPIISRARVLGSISLVTVTSHKIYTLEDLALAEELGRRAGIAIDNALLYAAAQKAIQARDEFLSIASHELKTPITSLKLQLQMTRRSVEPVTGKTPTPEKLAHILDVSTLQVNRLTALVEDLLDISRIESGKLTYHFETLNLSELVNEMVERYRDHLTSEGIVLTCHTPGDLFVSGDRFRMEQVILNLLSNAGKYGQQKPVEVTVTRTDQMAKISFRDQGLGIPKDKLGKVFERFERAVSSNNISGLGLGLYISQEIVKAHGGIITVESIEEVGSIFEVNLPEIVS